MSKPAAAARPVATCLQLVRRSLAQNPTRTLWNGLEHARLTVTEAQAVVNTLAARSGQLSSNALYFSGAVALAVVDRAIAPAPAPTYAERAEVAELGEWAQDDLEAAYAILHADRDAEALAAQAQEPVAASVAPEAGPVWELLEALDHALVHTFPATAGRPAQLLWLLARDQEVSAAVSLVGQLAARQGEGAVEVIAARGALRGAAQLLRERAVGLGHPASTARIERRLARVA